MDYTVHRILQARILEWVAVTFSKGSSQPRDQPRSPALQVDSLPAEKPGKPKNTGVGTLCLLQQIFLTQELNRGLLHCRRILSHWGSLVAQLVRNLPALWETWVRSLVWEYSSGGGQGTLLQYNCLENSHAQRSLAGYSPWGCKDSEMTEWLSIVQTDCIAQGSLINTLYN